MTSYIALLRGINVGGKTVKMDILKNAFAALGFGNVKTLLASGNVIFQSSSTDEATLARQIETKLHEVCGFEIAIVIRPTKYIYELYISNPFKSIKETDARFFVTFLSPKVKSRLTIPYESPNKFFKIIGATKGELFWVVYADGKTTDAMDVIDKKFGKKVTTRNWNTVKKLAIL